MNHVSSPGQTTPPDGRSVVYQNYLAVSIPVLLLGIATIAIQFEVPTILSNLMEEFNMSVQTASWLMSGFTLAGLIMSIPSGFLANRFGPKRTMLGGALIIIGGSLIGAFATNAYLLIISRFIEGAAYIIIATCGSLAVQKYVAPEKIGSATGIWTLYACLGAVMGGLVTPTLYESVGVKGLWLAYASIVLVTATILFFIVKDPQNTKTVEHAAPRQPIAVPDYKVFIRPNTLIYFLAFIIYNIVLMTVLSYAPTFMQQNGISATQSGFISTLPMLIAIVSAPLYGFVSDKIHRCKPLYVMAMLVMGPCAFLLMTQTGILMWTGAIIMGIFGLGAPVMCLAAYGNVLSSPHLLSIGMGVMMLMQCLGQTIGTYTAPLMLGANMSNWMFCGSVLLALSLLGVACVAVSKFR
jgi:MFS transporter, CP family, cyanate transporter